MKQLTTEAIVLARTDYGEADRIITLLTPDYGKVRLIAKGVRRVKSKLAGGIELFSVSTITFIKGRSDIGTLISARLEQHYGDIVKDINRTMLGYELLKQLNKAVEDDTEPAYFTILSRVLAGLNDTDTSMQLVQLWFMMQMLRIDGHLPNLTTDDEGNRLSADLTYDFDFDDMGFRVRPDGRCTPSHIKFMRLGFSDYSPQVLGQVQNGAAYAEDIAPIVRTMFTTYVHV